MREDNHRSSTGTAGQPTDGTTRRRVLQAASGAALATTMARTAAAGADAETAAIEEIDFRDGVPPVSDGPQGRDEVVFHVHGWSESGESVSAAREFQTTARDLGFDGTVAAVTWDDSGVGSARETGGDLAEWLADFRNENPGTTIRLLGYSMGAIVVTEAMVAIDGDFRIANADMIGSYEEASAPCRGAGFFDGIASSTRGMYNYWSANDYIARLGGSGASCSGSETPENYADVEVTGSVGGHTGYRTSRGCVQQILENYEDDGGGGSLSVATGAATDVGSDRATLSGRLESLGGASSAEVAVQYRRSGDDSWRVTSRQTLSAPGPFGRTVTGLSSGTEYEFRALATTADARDTGAVSTFVTEGDGGGDEAPTVETLDANSRCFWSCRFEVSWSVADADADLATVEAELYGSRDRLIDSAERDVSGGSAAGSDTLRSGWFDDPDRIVLRVTDEAGNTATDRLG